MKDTDDPADHIKNHVMRICRWYDCAKKALIEYTDPRYNIDRKNCLFAYESVGIDILHLPWLCSKYNDRLEWLSDEELWAKIRGRDVFSYLKEIRAEMNQDEKTKFLRNILNSVREK